MKVGAKNLITDVSGLLVGNASDDTLKSGVTVLTADQRFMASVEVMGGAPGTRETDLLQAEKQIEAIDALVLSGGSAYGVDAASGVVDGLRAAGRGFPVGDLHIPLVPAAILFDLSNGGDKNWEKNPYPALGRQAFDAAGADFDLGSVGAGTGAQAAMQKGGLGSASFVLESGITVGALVAANPFGSVTTPNGKHFWAAPFEMGGEFGGLGVDPASALAQRPTSLKAPAFNPRGNTTIAIVATDANLTKAQAKQLAVVAHDGMARAIVPAHTPYDGDLVFSVATGAKDLGASLNDLVEVGHAAAHCLTRAIARAIYHATPAKGDLMRCFRDNL